jgi:hypothetical protein
VNRWRYRHWRDLVSAWATIALDRLERPPGWERSEGRARHARRPAGAHSLVLELDRFAARVRQARADALRSECRDVVPGPG